ncbi:hypothetical protein RUND412_007999 [Rhizina undulata]
MVIHNEDANFEQSSLAVRFATHEWTSTEYDDNLNYIGPRVRGRTSSRFISEPTAQGCDHTAVGHEGIQGKKERKVVVTKEEKLLVRTTKREDNAGETVLMREDEYDDKDSYLALKPRSSKEESSTLRKRTIATD